MGINIELFFDMFLFLNFQLVIFKLINLLNSGILYIFFPRILPSINILVIIFLYNKNVISSLIKLVCWFL